MKMRGWPICDVILITGDAYIDHPSFGASVIGRYLENQGYRVGIISQPLTDNDFSVLGAPGYCFAVTSGNMDSMVCHYTSVRKRRSEDSFTENGLPGKRPDLAVIKYVQALKNLFKNIPVIIGGIEASLRRLVHYDYWTDKIKHSILLDSKADLLIYGMGEKAMLESVRSLEKGKSLKGIPGTAYTETKDENLKALENCLFLPSYAELKKNPVYLNDATLLYLKKYNKNLFIQKSENRWVVLNPPQPALSSRPFPGKI